MVGDRGFRRTVKLPIKDEAIWKIAELMAYAMFLNLFLLGAETFKEFYSATDHTLYTRYLWFGIGRDLRVPAHPQRVVYRCGNLQRRLPPVHLPREDRRPYLLRDVPREARRSGTALGIEG